MPSNLEARVASLRKVRSDQAVDSSRSTSKSTPVGEPYSSWLERDGERLEEWLAEQNADSTRRRASVQEQTTLAFLGTVDKMSAKANGKDTTEDVKVTERTQKQPQMGIERRWTTGEVHDDGDMLIGVGAFAGQEAPRHNNPQLSFTFSQQEDEPMPDAPPLNAPEDASRERPARP